MKLGETKKSTLNKIFQNPTGYTMGLKSILIS